MVKRKNIDRNIINVVKNYTRVVRLKGIDVEQSILFGSYAKGNEQKYSDIDICIVSDDFGKDELREIQKLMYLTHAVDERIEPLPFTNEELTDKNCALSEEINKYGIRIV